MDSKHTGILFHSEIRWLSRGTVLKRLFGLRHEVHLFFKNMTLLSSHFEDEFSKLNDLNLNLQGNGNNIFLMEDKVHAFYLQETACVARTSEIRKFCSISYSAGFP
jgi:hypothetical protein